MGTYRSKKSNAADEKSWVLAEPDLARSGLLLGVSFFGLYPQFCEPLNPKPVSRVEPLLQPHAILCVLSLEI